MYTGKTVFNKILSIVIRNLIKNEDFYKLTFSFFLLKNPSDVILIIISKFMIDLEVKEHNDFFSE